MGCVYVLYVINRIVQFVTVGTNQCCNLVFGRISLWLNVLPICHRSSQSGSEGLSVTTLILPAVLLSATDSTRSYCISLQQDIFCAACSVCWYEQLWCHISCTQLQRTVHRIFVSWRQSSLLLMRYQYEGASKVPASANCPVHNLSTLEMMSSCQVVHLELLKFPPHMINSDENERWLRWDVHNCWSLRAHRHLHRWAKKGSRVSSSGVDGGRDGGWGPRAT